MIYNLPRAKKKGETWYLNESIYPTAVVIDNIEFVSNSKTFTKMSCQMTNRINNLFYDTTSVASGIGRLTDGEFQITDWTDEAYRTITLASPATGDMLTWLQANAVKQ